MAYLTFKGHGISGSLLHKSDRHNSISFYGKVNMISASFKLKLYASFVLLSL